MPTEAHRCLRLTMISAALTLKDWLLVFRIVKGKPIAKFTQNLIG